MKKYLALFVFLLFIMSEAKTEKIDPENTLIIELKDGKVVIEFLTKMHPIMLHELKN